MRSRIRPCGPPSRSPVHGSDVDEAARREGASGDRHRDLRDRAATRAAPAARGGARGEHCSDSDPGGAAARRSVIENGVEAPEFAGGLSQMLELVDAMDASLSPGGWLSGDAFGLADAGVLPYVLRLDHLAMTPLIEARPQVAGWYARVQALPAYEGGVSRWLSPRWWRCSAATGRPSARGGATHSTGLNAARFTRAQGVSDAASGAQDWLSRKRSTCESGFRLIA